MSFTIVTDTSANIPSAYLKENNIRLIPYTFTVGGKVMSCTDTEEFDGKAFFDSMRQGERVDTSQINPQSYIDIFEELLKEGQDILFVSMSSGISGSYNSSLIAMNQLREDYPERTLRSVDTRGASLGEGLVVFKAVELREQGKSAAEAADFLEVYRDNIYNVFTVDDLQYLRRTGRLSNAAAVIGMVLNVKPILIGDELGRIISIAKVRGRKRAIETLAKRYDELAVHPEQQTVCIAHADCEEEAEELRALLNRNHPPKEFLTVMYEPVTGSHVGPGTLALFFESREGARLLR